MNNLHSRIRIGSAQVDTFLEKTNFKPGEEVEARVDIKGGDSDQHLDELYFAILTRYKDAGWRTGVIDEFRVLESTTIHPDTEESHEVTFPFPYNTPLTKGGDKVWLKTGTDGHWHVDPNEHEPLKIEPDERMERLFEALEGLGFVFQNAQCEKAPHYTTGAFIQELNFRPRSGRYRNKIDGLDVMLDGAEDRIDTYLEIDARPQGVGGMYDEMVDMDESFERFSFHDESTDELEDTLGKLLDQHT